MKKQNGITLVALIITVILMLILLSVGVKFGTDAVKKAKLEDIITDMLSIKTRAKILAEESNYNDDETLPGEEVTDGQIRTKLGIDDPDKKIFKWGKQVLNDQGLGNIEENVYLVYYDTTNPNDCEVYYLEGYDGVYSLTDLQDK